jgi:hypothetical protein
LDPDPDLDPDPYWSPTSYSGSGSGKNEYGSTTLLSNITVKLEYGPMVTIFDPLISGVADPECLTKIPDSSFSSSNPEYRVGKIPDPHQRI